MPPSISNHPRTCVVTGSSGFLGRFLLPTLTTHGVETQALSHSDPAINSSDSLAEWLREVNAHDIVHMAASSNPASNDWRGFYEANAFLTETLLEAAEQVGLAGRFVLLSATSVYGQTDESLLTEDTPQRPMNHYGASKMLAEVMATWKRDRLNLVIARPSNCIGAGQNPRYLVPKLVAAYAATDAVLPIGDIDIARDFVDIRDATDILARIVLSEEPVPEAINVSSGRATTIKEILTTLSKLTGHSPEIRRDERFIRVGDMRYQRCDSSRALKLGHLPQYELRDSLSWMLETFKDTNMALTRKNVT